MTSREIDKNPEQEIVVIETSNVKRRVGSSFFRGEDTNFGPQWEDWRSDDVLENFVLKGWTPGAPIILRAHQITSFGSCFAANIAAHLGAHGFSLSNDQEPDIHISRIGDGLVNTFSLLQQFEWAWQIKEFNEPLWHGYEGEAFSYDETIRRKTRQVFDATDVFILTLDLSEIWYDAVTSNAFWRAIPLSAFDPKRHKFRVSSFAENKANILRIIDLIAARRPTAKILFTVSPIPLIATFRPISAVSANSVSKALLRAALDEAFRDRQADLGDSLFYFPSYEIVNAFPNRHDRDGAHLRPYIIEICMEIFESYYCETLRSQAEVGKKFSSLIQRSKSLPDELEPLRKRHLQNLAAGEPI